MARVLLILPHLPQRMGCPYLGQQYVASSLLAAGHDVKALDLAAVNWRGDDSDAVRLASEWQPDAVGMTLFTYNAARGYRLARALREVVPLLVAGGPHPTVLPCEPLEHGFDVSVQGEGEVVMRQLLAQDRDTWVQIPGVHHLTAPGEIVGGPPYEPIEDLDSLAFPLNSYPCFDPTLYAPGVSDTPALVVPGGLMTSRGCPARCTFCANYVTGRAYRWRSTENVIGELRALVAGHGIRHFSFWDDAFTARRDRLEALCDAILADPELRGITWTCITPGNMVKPRDLQKMRAAGCVAVNFGIESGDPVILKSIQKGQRPEHIVAAVDAAKAAGMTTVVNFMFGFPGEGLDSLRRTQQLMERLAPVTDVFNNRGVLVPFPGTGIYDAHHEAYGFTDWWLDPARIPDEPNIADFAPDEALRYLEEDPSLAQDYFSYTPEVRDRIAECVRFKARHNASRLAR